MTETNTMETMVIGCKNAEPRRVDTGNKNKEQWWLNAWSGGKGPACEAEKGTARAKPESLGRDRESPKHRPSRPAASPKPAAIKVETPCEGGYDIKTAPLAKSGKQLIGGKMRRDSPPGPGLTVDNCISNTPISIVHDMNIPPKRNDSQEKITVSSKDLRWRVKIARESAGYDNKNFALALDVRPSTVSDIENGKSTPSLETLLKIVEITKCDPGWLLTGRFPGVVDMAENPEPPGVMTFESELKIHPRTPTEPELRKMAHMGFSTWQRLTGPSAEALFLETVRPGEASDLLKTGDIVAIDLEDKSPDWGLFLVTIRVNEKPGAYYRRVKKASGGKWTVSGPTPNDPPEEHDEPDVVVKGRVLGFYRPL